jgi:hypothetical protein
LVLDDAFYLLWKEAVMTYFKVMPQDMFAGMRESTKPQIG